MARRSPLINLLTRLAEDSKEVVDEAIDRLADAERDFRNGLQHLIENRKGDPPRIPDARSGQAVTTDTA